jgi:hypothetical protein
MSARSRIMGKQFGRKPALEAVWNGRCWTRTIVGELLAALADCNEALRLKPDVAATLDSRGLIYRRPFSLRDLVRVIGCLITKLSTAEPAITLRKAKSSPIRPFRPQISEFLLLIR